MAVTTVSLCVIGGFNNNNDDDDDYDDDVQATATVF